jgi:uncharacterized phage infection (PIP) family protein YhgE
MAPSNGLIWYPHRFVTRHLSGFPPPQEQYHARPNSVDHHSYRQSTPQENLEMQYPSPSSGMYSVPTGLQSPIQTPPRKAIQSAESGRQHLSQAYGAKDAKPSNFNYLKILQTKLDQLESKVETDLERGEQMEAFRSDCLFDMQALRDKIHQVSNNNDIDELKKSYDSLEKKFQKILDNVEDLRRLINVLQEYLITTSNRLEELDEQMERRLERLEMRQTAA